MTEEGVRLPGVQNRLCCDMEGREPHFKIRRRDIKGSDRGMAPRIELLGFRDGVGRSRVLPG